nr:hypothetical protein BaRGS_035111 [Batillaria attramentaria]
MHVTETTALTSSGGVEVKQEVDAPTTTTATTASTSDTITTTTIDNAPTSVTPVNGTVSVTGLIPALGSNGSSVISEIQRKVEAELDGDSNCSSSSCVDSLASNGCWGMPMEEESDASMRKRLFTSLSQSFPGSALSRMLHSMDTMPLDSEDEDLVSPDKLSSSCFAEIRLDKGEIEDDELTSLTWLQDADLLKNINAGEDDHGSEAEEQKENDEGRKNGEAGVGNFVPQTHPPHVPYNPLKHVNSKPPYSFSCLIFMAVEDSPQKKLPVKDIYNWILTHFPYFQNAPTGWKNSVRHNLSLNKCFKKVEKDKGQSIGKGSLWCIDPDYRPNLLQALRKTPYHPYHQLQMMSTMPQQLKFHHVHGLPGEDHTYSATRVREEDDASGTSSIDNEYDFGSGDEDDDISEPSECPSDWDCGSDGDEVDGVVPPILPRKRLKIDLKRRTEEDDEDEEMKQEDLDNTDNPICFPVSSSSIEGGITIILFQAITKTVTVVDSLIEDLAQIVSISISFAVCRR